MGRQGFLFRTFRPLSFRTPSRLSAFVFRLFCLTSLLFLNVVVANTRPFYSMHSPQALELCCSPFYYSFALSNHLFSNRSGKYTITSLSSKPANPGLIRSRHHVRLRLRQLNGSHRTLARTGPPKSSPVREAMFPPAHRHRPRSIHERVITHEPVSCRRYYRSSQGR